MDLMRLILGFLSMILGRRLFWLFVGGVGFIAGMSLTSQFFGGQSEVIVLIIAFAAGLLGILLALFLQKIAIWVVGFLAGGYLSVGLMDLLMVNMGQYNWLVFVVGGILGSVLAFVLFDWALIILSSVFGALLIAQAIQLPQSATLASFVNLVIIWVLAQTRIN